jgi:hypothetical protein
MKKIKWLGIGTSSALSVGVVATAAIIQATSSGVVSFNPGILEAIEEVVANQDQAESFEIGNVTVPGLNKDSKNNKQDSSDNTINDDSDSSSDDDSDLSSDDVDDSSNPSISAVSPVTVVTVVSVVSNVTPVSVPTASSVVSPVSSVTPASPISNN